MRMSVSQREAPSCEGFHVGSRSVMTRCGRASLHALTASSATSHLAGNLLTSEHLARTHRQLALKSVRQFCDEQTCYKENGRCVRDEIEKLEFASETPALGRLQGG